MTTAAVDNNSDGIWDRTEVVPATVPATFKANRVSYTTVGTYTNGMATATTTDTFLDSAPKTAPLVPLNANSEKNAQLWGGLVINGDGFTNNSNQVDVDGNSVINNLDVGKGIVEGLTGTDAIYGGTNNQHNAGVIKYVSIRHGGVGLAADKEINALTFYAVGKDTTVENIDIYCTSDDGVEIFGGDVNLKFVNVNYADDDGFDVDEGWRGSVQFLFVLNGLGYGDNGMEMDGEDKGENQAGVITPLPYGRVYNATIWQSKAGSNGARFRAGYAGVFANSIVQYIGTTTSTSVGVRVDSTSSSGAAAESAPSARNNFGTGLFQIRNVSTAGGFSANYTSFTDTLSLGATGAVTGSFGGSAIANALYPTTLNRNNLANFAALSVSTMHTTANGINPRPDAVATSGAYATPQNFGYVGAPIVPTEFRGAFNRDAVSLWTTGWTALNARGILKN
jgi:hypothetical protein